MITFIQLDTDDGVHEDTFMVLQTDWPAEPQSVEGKLTELGIIWLQTDEGHAWVKNEADSSGQQDVELTWYRLLNEASEAFMKAHGITILECNCYVQKDASEVISYAPKFCPVCGGWNIEGPSPLDEYACDDCGCFFRAETSIGEAAT